MKTIESMSADSRVWIYQADRKLSDAEVDYIELNGFQFIEEWSSHGANMDASIGVYYNRILVIAADESQAQASGCGIDKSVRFVKELGESLNMDFFQRTQVLYKDSNEILEKPIHEFWAMRKAGIIQDNTIVLDNTVKTVGDLLSSWEVPFKKSWHAEMWGR